MTLERRVVYKALTKTKFINWEDALDLGKLRIFMGIYEKGQGMKVGAYAFADVADLRVLFADLSWGKSVKWVDYKGSRNSAGQVISRIFTVKTADSRADGIPMVWFEVKNGPGKMSETGAVMPAGEPTASVAIGLSVDAARRLALSVLAYIDINLTARAVLAAMPSLDIKKVF